MAPRTPGNNAAAEDTVFGNLGLDREELGLEADDAQDDLGTGDDQQQDDQGDDGHQQLDDLRVSHTGDDRQQQRQQPKPFPQRSEVKPDGKGNLVDATGKIVARAGSEARLYQNLHQVRQQLQQRDVQTADMNRRLSRAVEIGQELARENDQFKAQQKAITDLGIKPEDQLAAMQLYSRLQRDPENEIKRILTRAAANGIKLDNLSTPGGVDAKSLLDTIREEIGKSVNPLRERSLQEEKERKAEADRQAALQRTTDEVNQFFMQNQDAQPFVPVFQQVLSDPRFKHMSLGEIWARIQLNQMRNGNSQPRRQPNSQSRSLPSGRNQPQQGNSGMAPVNATYDEILRGVLTEHNVV